MRSANTHRLYQRWRVKIHNPKFDATQDHARGGRIAIAYGRDAADVALVTQFGPARLDTLRVWVDDAASTSA